MNKNKEEQNKRIEHLLWAVYSAHEEPHSSSSCIKYALESINKEISQAEDNMRKKCLSEFANVLKTTPYRTQTDTSLSGFIERVLFQSTQNINNLDKE